MLVCQGRCITARAQSRIVSRQRRGCVPDVPLRRRRCGGSSALRAVRVVTAAKQEFSNETKLRSEAQAPFRVARQFIYAALGGSALIGGGIALIQLVTGALGAPSAPPLAQSAPNLAIDAGVLALMAFLFRREEAARELQMGRISREERLGNLRAELTGGKLVRLSRLRGFCRVVVAAGPASEVDRAIAAAEPFRAALQERGVLFVPFATDGGAVAASAAAADAPAPTSASPSASAASSGDAAAAPAAAAAAAAAAEKRWRAAPVFPSEWSAWFAEQTALAKIAPGTAVYVSLRMDGRVRASGVGLPPWEVLATALPPTDGFFAGFLDGARAPQWPACCRHLPSPVLLPPP